MIDLLRAVAQSPAPLTLLACVTLLLPAFGSLVILLLNLSGIKPYERWIALVSAFTVSGAALAAVLLAGLTMLRPGREFDEVLWTMYAVGDHHLDVSVFVDPLSAMLTALGGCVIPVLGRFSASYLHREPGYLRFFVLVGVAGTGFFWFVLGGSVDMAFFGWELLGLSSALLVAFYWERPETVVASGRIFATYRVADIALLAGVVLLHHYEGSSDWATVLGVGSEARRAPIGSFAATVLALAFLLAAIGKSAQFPVSSYILRAMEGPTPSSALFYGTLSIHAGVYLMLRVEPLFDHAPVARGCVVAVGLSTALSSSLGSRVRADAKGALALATSAQAGLMLVEVGVGLRQFAMWHLLGHGLLRLIQFLRAPSWLDDAQARRRALGGGRYRADFHLEQLFHPRLRSLLYAAALSHFGIDALVDRWLLRPLAALAHVVSSPRRRIRERHGGRIAEGVFPMALPRSSEEPPARVESRRQGP
jgi:NADH-quinone oxidoreductase subunit L